MGTALGVSLVSAGRTVLWASSGRSEATRRRAETAGFEDVGTLEAVVARAQLLVSICPPAAAVEVATSVADRGFDGTYLDANAIARSTAESIAAIVATSGASFVDGAVIGPADFAKSRTTLVLAGDRAGDVAAAFAAGPPATLVLEGAAGTASALKVCYAAWTKGTAALQIAIRALAAHEGVEAQLLEQWASRDGDLGRRSTRALEKASTHGWRWVGEMEQIAANFADAGLPDGFHAAAARVFEAFPRTPDEVVTPSLEVFERLTAE